MQITRNTRRVAAALAVAWLLALGTLAALNWRGAWSVALFVWGGIGLAHVLAWATGRERQWERPLRIAYRFGAVVVIGAFVAMLVQASN